jgi:hypothetical protein
LLPAVALGKVFIALSAWKACGGDVKNLAPENLLCHQAALQIHLSLHIEDDFMKRFLEKLVHSDSLTKWTFEEPPLQKKKGVTYLTVSRKLACIYGLIRQVQTLNRKLGIWNHNLQCAQAAKLGKQRLAGSLLHSQKRALQQRAKLKKTSLA